MGPMPDHQYDHIDVSAMRDLLDGRYREVRDRVRENLVKFSPLLDNAEEMTRDGYRDAVRDVVIELAGTGQTAYGLPKEYGGASDVGASVAAFETSGYGDLSVLVKLGVQFGLFGGAVHQLGTERHHRKYMADIATGKLLGGFAMTETGHGSNVQALGTTATYEHATGEFVLHTPDDESRKDYIGNAANHGRMAVVFAQLYVDGTNHGVHAFIAPLRDSKGKVVDGVRIEDCGHKHGLNGVDNGRIWFEGLRIPREDLLDRYADVDEHGVYHSPIDNPDRRFFTMLGTLVLGRVCVGGGALHASKVALKIATSYGNRRRQFGPKDSEQEIALLDYGQHQRRLIPLIARTYGLHFAQERLAADLHRIFGDMDSAPERRRRALESRAAATKAMATWQALDTIQTCREACGGAGYLTVNRFAALYDDVDVFTTFEGDNTVLLQLVAKGRLTDLQAEFGSFDQLEMARYVAGIAMDTIVERTRAREILERLKDAVPGRGRDATDPDAGLLDGEWHHSMFKWREEHLTAGAARRLKSGIDAGGDPAEVFSRVQPHVIAVARAHAERLFFEAFLTKVQNTPEGTNRTVLHALCDLFALSMIEDDRAWFMEHGRLSTERSKAVVSAVEQLCRQLRPHVEDLVDAFAIPAELLRVEII
jgi:acyl-CoA oxidase